MDKRRDLGLKVLVGVVGLAALVQTVSFRTGDESPGEAAPSPSLAEQGTNITVPDLVGLETRSAAAMLEGLGLSPFLEETEPGGLWSTVVGQATAPGTELAPGTAVNLEVTTATQPPLNLPAMSGDTCPTTAVHPSPRFRQVIGDGRIRLASATEDGSINLSGTEVEEGRFRISTLWTTGRGYDGPALVRGDRIDAPGSIEFEQDIDVEAVGPPLVGQPDEMHFAAGGAPGGFAWGAALTLEGGPGCYAFQIDGDDFTEHIVVEAAG